MLIPCLPFNLLSLYWGEKWKKGASWQAVFFQASMATSFLLGLASTRLQWEIGAEGRIGQGIPSPLPRPVPQ